MFFNWASKENHRHQLLFFYVFGVHEHFQIQTQVILFKVSGPKRHPVQDPKYLNNHWMRLSMI